MHEQPRRGSTALKGLGSSTAIAEGARAAEADMNATHEIDDLAELKLDGQVLRERLAMLADSIARTEDDVAATLDRLAVARPRDAARLRARAQFARMFAASERERAYYYGSATADADREEAALDGEL